MKSKSIKPRFNRWGRKLKPGKKSWISIEVYWRRDLRIFLDTEFSVLLSEWDKKKRCVNNTNSNYSYINSQLKDRISKIESYEYALQNNGRSLTPELLEEFAAKNYMNHQGRTFTDYFEHLVNTRKFDAPSTKSHHKKTFNKLKAFQKVIFFQDLTIAFIEKFDQYMLEQGLKLNSRSNHHKTIKANLALAASDKLIKHSDIPYVTQLGGASGKFSIKKEAGSIMYLDFEERERIEELSYPHNQTYERYRKIFLFMCYTGLRISDMENFRLSHLHYCSKGYEIDLHKMVKTRKPLFLQLYNLFEGKPEIILKDFLIESFGTDNYDDLMALNDNSVIFQELTGQVINRELKVIANDARIYKNLSNHVGRHTFGTQMAYLTNGNVNLVRDLMGHGKADTTMRYIRLADKMRGRLLQQVDWNSHKEIAIEPEPKSTENNNTQEHNSESEGVKTESNQLYIQLREQIYENVFPEIKLKTKGKALFAISDESLKRYTDLLPFSPEDFSKYQKKPIEIDGYIFEPQFMDNIEEVQDAINKHPWFKGACMKIRIMFTPITNGHQTTYI